MTWPSLVLILALLIIIAVSVIGIIRASDVQKSFGAVACSVSILFDDILNGNATVTG